jgi:hypothetical protein
MNIFRSVLASIVYYFGRSCDGMCVNTKYLQTGGNKYFKQCT